MFNVNFADPDYSQEQYEKICEWTEMVLKEFEISAQFKNLSKSEQDDCHFLISVFYENCYNYCLVGPGNVSTEVIDEMMLDVMPRKISADISVFEAFSPIMTQFLQWCEEKRYLKNTQTTIDYINQLSSRLIERASNPKYWGMAKSFVSGGFPQLNFGNNLEDSDDDEFDMDRYSGIFKEAPFKRDEPKIGRNDICSCGSGKKYKKCCLLN